MKDIDIKLGPSLHQGKVLMATTTYEKYYFPKHFHEHYTILFVEKGVNEGFTERNPYKVENGGVLVINPGDIHAGNSYKDKALKFFSLKIEEEFIRQFLDKNNLHFMGDIYFETSPIYDAYLNRAMLSFFDIKENCSGDRYEESLNLILGILLKSYSNQKIVEELPPLKAMSLAHQFIHDRFKENFTLDELAKASNLSAFHLVRQFKSTFGLTPFQYMRNLRIEKAKTLLDKANITQVAHEVGFYDHSHFLKSFKKIEGILPSHYSRYRSGI